tara:strand:+ start:462 stop:746 length:285 start_codon:yes stop_codon:yes gene_type:complete
MTWKYEIKKAKKVYVVVKKGPYYSPKDLDLYVFDDKKKAEEALAKVTSYNEDGSIDDGSGERTKGEAYIFETNMNNDFSDAPRLLTPIPKKKDD